MQYFNLVAAEGEQTYLLKSYQIHKFDMIRVGMSYKFAKVIKKPDAMWIVSTSQVGYAKGVTVADNLILPTLPENEPPTGVKRTLSEALLSPQRSIVQAKIIKVSPVKFRQEGKLAVRCLGLKDQSGYAKVALFSTLAEETFAEGSVLELSALYKKEHQKKVQLTMTRGTTCQFLPDDAIEVTLSGDDNEHFSRDADFCVSDTSQNLEIDAVYDVVPYECCTNSGCHKKKVVDGICPTCQGDATTWTCRAKDSLQTADHTVQKDITLFEGDLTKLFGQLKDMKDEPSIVQQLVE